MSVIIRDNEIIFSGKDGEIEYKNFVLANKCYELITGKQAILPFCKVRFEKPI